MHISGDDEGTAANERLGALLDAQEFEAAVSFADACHGTEYLVLQLRAIASTHAGAGLRDVELLERGAELWRALGGESNSAHGYNLANAELDLWQLAVEQQGFVAALESARGHLQHARALFARSGRDASLNLELRVQALTNLGNSYDVVGRDADALDAYDQALSLDCTFGMALGNKGLTLLGIAPFVAEHQPSVLMDAARVGRSAGRLRAGGRNRRDHRSEIVRAIPGEDRRHPD